MCDEYIDYSVEEADRLGKDFTQCPACRSLSFQGENTTESICKNCSTRFCYACACRLTPVLIHGNCYHRPECIFYEEDDLNDPENNFDCEMCRECDDICDPPFSLRVPKRITVEEI